MRVPWTARISNQSMLKDINPEYSLEGLMLKPKLQYFGHLLQRADSLERIPMQGKIEGRRRRGWQRTRWLDVNADSVDMSLSELWEMVKDLLVTLEPTFDPWVRKMPWRTKWQPTPVFFPGESHGAWQATVPRVTRLLQSIVRD